MSWCFIDDWPSLTLCCRDFLLSEGDLNIEYGEWQLLSRPVPEDVSKLPFSYSRPFAYAHPRTTMLMFGPKNAPATQVQYLYMPCDMNTETLETVRPRRGLIVNITQFDGIPMADVFKVMQYWAFEALPADPSKTVVRVGLAMHYIKSSMFKSQIFGGTRDELTDQLKKWFPFADRRIAQYQAAAAEQIALDEEQDEFAAETDVAGMTPRSRTNSEVGLVAAQSSFEFKRRSSSSSPAFSSTRRLSMGREQPTFQQQVHSSAPSPQSAAIPPLYWCALVLLLLLVLSQWWQNRSLSAQVNSLSARFELNQQSTETSMRESLQLIQQLLTERGK